MSNCSGTPPSLRQLLTEHLLQKKNSYRGASNDCRGMAHPNSDWVMLRSLACSAYTHPRTPEVSITQPSSDSTDSQVVDYCCRLENIDTGVLQKKSNVAALQVAKNTRRFYLCFLLSVSFPAGVVTIACRVVLVSLWQFGSSTEIAHSTAHQLCQLPVLALLYITVWATTI